MRRPIIADLRTKQAPLWRSWVVDQALPLWIGAGYDRSRSLFHERLTFQAEPISLPNLRVMVQARQIATYCRAAIDGLFDATDEALSCMEQVKRLYWRRDGQKGWVFALGPDGTPSDTTRDLYAHAFVLYALAWAYRLGRDPALLSVARQSTEELIDVFSAPYGGFLDSVPLKGHVRRQNPHMHLLEAFLALFDVTQDSFYLDQIRSLVSLAETKFVETDFGMLLEFFDEDWSPIQPKGQNVVEPGHLFEWSWLLRESGRLDPENPGRDRHIEISDRLFDVGTAYGMCHGVVCDGVTDRGIMREKTARIWPQTELIRLLIERDTHNTPDQVALLSGLTEAFFTRFVPPTLNGGWIDRVDESGVPLVDYMPASSFYHIYGAARAF